MDSIIEETEHKAEGMSDIVKLGILAGTLGLTGLVAYSLREGGYLAKKMAKGPGRVYLAGGGETAASLAAKYNASGRESEIVAANSGLSWPLSNGDHVTVPDSWAQLYSAKTSSGPAWSGVDSVHVKAGLGQAEEGSEGVENTTESDWTHLHHSADWHAGYSVGFKTCESQNRVGSFTGSTTPAVEPPKTFPSHEFQQGYQAGISDFIAKYKVG